MEKVWLKVWPDQVPQTLDYGELPLSKYLEQQARDNPKRKAIIFYGTELTYGELNELVNRFAAGLQQLGIGKGDRVGLYLENCPQFIIAFYAVMRAGAIVVTLNPMFKTSELAFEIIDAGIETLVVQDTLYPYFAAIGEEHPVKRVIVTSLHDFLPKVPQLPLHAGMLKEKQSYPGTFEFTQLLRKSQRPFVEVTLDIDQDLALLQYTSGTTGMPKGAMISHRNIVVNTIGAVTWSNYAAEEVYLSVLPFFHVTGMVHSMCIPLFTGGLLFCLRVSRPRPLSGR